MDDICLILVTAPQESAESLGRAMVEKRLAACVNVIPTVQSIYWWQGKVETGAESLLLFKTPAHLSAEFETVLKSLHPYAVPEIIVTPVTGGLAEYLNWVVASTRSTGTTGAG